MVIDGNDVIIRLRDGGPAFNLKYFADRLKEEGNLEAGIGIKMIVTSAKSVSYYRTYGMNTTIVRV